MTIKNTMGRINPDCERATWWQEVYGSFEVPLLSPLPIRLIGPNGEAQSFYKVDLSKLPPQQHDKAAQFVANKFGLPIDEVRKDMNEYGIPILAEDVTVSFDARLVL